jgi:hypothetical protein
MTCREFRRWLMIDPNRRDEQFLDHLGQCQECAWEAERAWEFEKKLLAAFDAEPPEGLVQAPAPPPMEFRRWALATGLSLALGLSAWLGIHSGLYPGLRTELSVVVLEHIKNEPDSLRVDRKLSAGAMELMLSDLGARLTADPGPVRYMGRCHIREQYGLHLVLPGKRGPVTVLLMPGEHVPERRLLDSVSFSGVIVPTDYGSMAVVGSRREPVESVIERMQKSVAWKPTDRAI